jgi:hypothetical protein
MSTLRVHLQQAHMDQLHMYNDYERREQAGRSLADTLLSTMLDYVDRLHDGIPQTVYFFPPEQDNTTPFPAGPRPSLLHPLRRFMGGKVELIIPGETADRLIRAVRQSSCRDIDDLAANALEFAEVTHDTDFDLD